MGLSARKLNTFTLFKLPSAWFCGVRVKELNENSCTVSVKQRWFNQNPFNSIFWAVQGMAAELASGAMLASKIGDSKKNISMLVANNKANFSKKARGRIFFKCEDGHLINKAIDAAILTGEGQTFWMQSIGKDKHDDIVSTFDFEWTIKLKE